jgi:hypothetical protein
MKKLIFLSLILTSLTSYSQKYIGDNNPKNPEVVEPPKYAYFWGDATRDTCTASSTLSFVIKTAYIGAGYFEFYPYVVKVSGTVTNKIFFYKSGISYPYNWVKVDSIVNTNISTGYLTPKQISDWRAPYMKIEVNAGAVTQKAYYKMPFNVVY